MIDISMKKEDITLVVGFFLVVGSIFASIFLHYYFWYSFYVFGASMFFGSLNYKRRSKSVFSYFLENKWKIFFRVYFLGVLFGLVVDVIYGRRMGDLWHYPHLQGIKDFIFPVFFYYPFGGLQVYEIFYFCKSLLSKKLNQKKSFILKNKTKEIIINSILVLLSLGLIVPLVNYAFNRNFYANTIMMIVMIFTVFSVDAILYKLKKESMFLEFIQGNKLIIGTMLFSWFVAVLLTEVPNTFSWEWIYYHIPFTQFAIFKINILIFTFGWFWLVYLPVSYLDLIKHVFKLKEPWMKKVR